MYDNELKNKNKNIKIVFYIIKIILKKSSNVSFRNNLRDH